MVGIRKHIKFKHIFLIKLNDDYFFFFLEFYSKTLCKPNQWTKKKLQFTNLDKQTLKISHKLQIFSFLFDDVIPMKKWV